MEFTKDMISALKESVLKLDKKIDDENREYESYIGRKDCSIERKQLKYAIRKDRLLLGFRKDNYKYACYQYFKKCYEEVAEAFAESRLGSYLPVFLWLEEKTGFKVDGYSDGMCVTILSFADARKNLDMYVGGCFDGSTANLFPDEEEYAEDMTDHFMTDREIAEKVISLMRILDHADCYRRDLLEALGEYNKELPKENTGIFIDARNYIGIRPEEMNL